MAVKPRNNSDIQARCSALFPIGNFEPGPLSYAEGIGWWLLGDFDSLPLAELVRLIV
jgi:hypothetical protein